MTNYVQVEGLSVLSTSKMRDGQTQLRIEQHVKDTDGKLHSSLANILLTTEQVQKLVAELTPV